MTIYRIDPARSRATVDATSSVHPIHSETDGLTGWLELQVNDAGRPNLRSRKGAEISLEVERLRSGNPWKTESFVGGSTPSATRRSRA